MHRSRSGKYPRTWLHAGPKFSMPASEYIQVPDLVWLTASLMNGRPLTPPAQGIAAQHR
jgi:hypothetical protein